MPGSTSHSYAGPDDRDMRPEIAKMQAEINREELIGAIRAFTRELPDDDPNGPHEADIEALNYALKRGDAKAAKQYAADLCKHLSEAVKRLRIAAEAHFGGDFREP